MDLCVRIGSDGSKIEATLALHVHAVDGRDQRPLFINDKSFYFTANPAFGCPWTDMKEEPVLF